MNTTAPSATRILDRTLAEPVAFRHGSEWHVTKAVARVAVARDRPESLPRPHPAPPAIIPCGKAHCDAMHARVPHLWHA